MSRRSGRTGRPVRRARRAARLRPRRAAWLLAAACALPSLAAPMPAAAQDGGAGAADGGAGVAGGDPGPPFSVSARMGFSAPRGDLGDLTDDGYVLGLALGRRVAPRVTLLLEGSLEDLLRGGRLGPGFGLGGWLGPNMELWRVMGLASVELTDPAASRWEVAVQAGAGATVVSADGFTDGDAFTATEPTLMAGLLTGFDVTPRFTLFARGGGSIWFDGTGPGGGENYLGKEVTLTQSLGLRVRF